MISEMTNGTGGPNLYTIDTCSEVRTIWKISTEGTAILITLKCLLGAVLELEAGNTHLGLTLFSPAPCGLQTCGECRVIITVLHLCYIGF